MGYALDTMGAAPDDALQFFVSNGYVREKTVDPLAGYLDAINVDIKGDREFYRDYTGVPDPEPIFQTVKQFADRDIHLEATNLIIPGKNDEETIRKGVQWLVEAVDPDVPVHFSRFRPAYRMRDVPPTPIETLERAIELACEARLRCVYCGNVPRHEAESTSCPACGRVVVRREGYTVRDIDLEAGSCPDRGRAIPIYVTP